MAKSKGVLCIDMVAIAIVHMFAFEEEAKKAVAEGGKFPGQTLVASEAEFNILPVDVRCKLARPFLNEKEAASTQEGEGFASVAYKICQRFKNAKPVKGTTEAPGKPPKDPVVRSKGVKTLIFDHFKANANTAHMSVEEIMAAVNGTKASVTTAISDLRSPKYAGSQGTMDLERLAGKYCLKGSKAAESAKKADDGLLAAVAAEKEAKAAAAKTEKEAKAKAAKEKAAATAKAAEKAPA